MDWEQELWVLISNVCGESGFEYKYTQAPLCGKYGRIFTAFSIVLHFMGGTHVSRRLPSLFKTAIFGSVHYTFLTLPEFPSASPLPSSSLCPVSLFPLLGSARTWPLLVQSTQLAVSFSDTRSATGLKPSIANDAG